VVEEAQRCLAVSQKLDAASVPEELLFIVVYAGQVLEVFWDFKKLRRGFGLEVVAPGMGFEPMRT
jgi:hypothetical protein